jgi:hypothetical protein
MDISEKRSTCQLIQLRISEMRIGNILTTKSPSAIRKYIVCFNRCLLYCAKTEANTHVTSFN